MRFFNALASCSLFIAARAQQRNLSGLLQSQTNLSDFTTLLNQYPDVFQNISSMKGITIFAPSNEAISKVNYSVLAPAFASDNVGFIRELLKYHVSPGIHSSESLTGSFQFLPSLLKNQSYTNVTGGQVIAAVEQAGNVSVAVTGLGSRSTLTTVNLAYDNGIVHMIDTMFIPPVDFASSASAFNLSAAPAAFFTAPPILLNYTNMAPSLTIFAPNNNALRNIESSLSSLSVKDLTSLLEYHIVPSTNGPYYSANLPNGLPYPGGNPENINNHTTLTSLQGGNLTITFTYNSLFVNQARVVQQDLLLSNGVLHIIDSVLDPNITTALPVPTATTPIQIFPGSATGGGLPFTNALPSTTSVLFSLVTATPTPTSIVSIQNGGGAATSQGGGGGVKTSKGLGEKVEVARTEMGWVLGVAVWMLGFL